MSRGIKPLEFKKVIANGQARSNGTEAQIRTCPNF